MKYLQADWCNLVLNIHNDLLLVCHFEIFAVGVRCMELSSLLEASSSFKEEVATTLAEGESVHTHFRQWLASISLHSSLRK